MIIRKKLRYEDRYKNGEWYRKFCWLPRWVPVGNSFYLVWLGFIERQARWSMNYNASEEQWSFKVIRLPDG